MYEIAGATTTGLTSADLLGREIVFAFAPDLQLPSGVVLGVQGGKRRLHIAGAEIQIQRQLATALMLPSPRRVNDTGSSRQLLMNKAYVVERIHLDFTNHLLPDKAFVVPGDIELKNLVGDLSIHTQQRLNVLRSVWTRSPQLPEPIRTLVRQHEELVTANKPIGTDCERIVASIQLEANRIWPDEAQETGDPLPALATSLNLDAAKDEPPNDEVLGGGFDIENIVGVPQRVRRTIIQRRGQWPFRQGLLAAYGHSCQVTRYTGEQALEAAHIYPYSEGGENTNDLRKWPSIKGGYSCPFRSGSSKGNTGVIGSPNNEPFG